MSEQNQPSEDVDRVTTEAPAEGAENPGDDTTAGTPHAQDPAEGVDPDEPAQR
ncbi:hypothetical protein [Tessaracoccus antarcticus]|uniref:hypothetical protein n=1 Tax=Tessaracoccus antarcticus TaxID=2479848 RepID=UPI001314FBE1|nr:hypothetical protein [Tessaracoccus antarcticus]